MLQAVVTVPASVPGATEPEGHAEAMLKRYEDGQQAALKGENYTPKKPDEGTGEAPAQGSQDGAPQATPNADQGAPQKTGGEQGEQKPNTSEQEDNAEADFVDNLLKSVGLTRDGIAKEFLSGGLSEKTYAALASKGVDRGSVDQYMAGVAAMLEQSRLQYQESLFKAAQVDETGYGELVLWAKDNYSSAEIEAYNRAVESGDVALASLAVSGLKARFSAANPAEPRLMQDTKSAVGTATYQSWAQVKADMKRPEYATDPAFREMVRAKLAASGDLA